MIKRTFIRCIALASLFLGLGVIRAPAAAQTGAPALMGTVSSTAEGAMEGVLVSAKRDGSNMTITVVSNADGVYSFPRGRLQPGQHTISIRAVGYVLAAESQRGSQGRGGGFALPMQTRVASVRSEGTTTLNFQLETADILTKALQLSSAEWLHSYPLPDETKFGLLNNCTRCHSQQKPAFSVYTEEQLPSIMARMIYFSGSTELGYQIPANLVEDWGRGDGVMAGPPTGTQMQQAKAVAAINLSGGTWNYPLKTFPRPEGNETQVIMTMYDLPSPQSKPHDTQVGLDGWIYYPDFNRNLVGKLNPETGETQEWPFDDYLGGEGGFLTPVGNRTLHHDGKGKFYVGTRVQGAIVVFDSKSETFEYYPGASFGMVDAKSEDVDGWSWTNDPIVKRIMLHGDGEWTEEIPQTERVLCSYDVNVDSKNNAWGGSRGCPYAWMMDAKTMEATYYEIPETPRGEGGLGTGMRRSTVDGQDRFWFGGFDSGTIGMVDPRLPEGEQVKLWEVPIPWFQTYDAQNDDAGYTWGGSISADRVVRLNEATGEMNIYLLPGHANIRNVDVQRPENGGLSSLWIGMNHQARLIHIEPLVP